MAKSDEDIWIITLVVVFTAIGAVLAFSKFFGLDPGTGGAVLLSLLLWMGVTVGCWKFGDDVPFIHPRKSWPLLLALLVVCWWPALDVWARHQSPRLWADEEVTLWWNAWYTKLAVILAGLGGYAVNLRRGEW